MGLNRFPVEADTSAAVVGFMLNFNTLAKAALMGLYKRWAASGRRTSRHSEGASVIRGAWSTPALWRAAALDYRLPSNSGQRDPPPPVWKGSYRPANPGSWPGS